MTNLDASRVAPLARILRLARVVGNDALSLTIRKTPQFLVTPQIYIYGVTESGDIVAVADGKRFLLQKGQVGVAQRTWRQFEQLQAQLRACLLDPAEVRVALEGALINSRSHKNRRLACELLNGGIDALYNTSWNEVSQHALERQRTARPVQKPSKTKGSITSSNVALGQSTRQSEHAFWLDPDNQNWH